MTSRRTIENKVERLEEGSGGNDGDPLIMNLASIDHAGQWPTKDDAKHPELVVKPYPERKPKLWDYTIPWHIPERYLQGAFLTVCAEESHDKYGVEPGTVETHITVAVSTLWESLSDDDLRREYEYRKENGEPIPDILTDYE